MSLKSEARNQKSESNPNDPNPKKDESSAGECLHSDFEHSDLIRISGIRISDFGWRRSLQLHENKKRPHGGGLSPCGLGGGGNEDYWRSCSSGFPIGSLRIEVIIKLREAPDSVPPADRLQAVLSVGTNRAP